MLKVTRATYSACGCTVEYCWLTEAAEENREHIALNIQPSSGCLLHAHMGKPTGNLQAEFAELLADVRAIDAENAKQAEDAAGK